MSKKIVAIGGGSNGARHPYELAAQDREIIHLTKKEHPNVLFLAHAQPVKAQESCFLEAKNVFEARYGCFCKDLKSDELTDLNAAKALVDWADIIYEAGGNTLDMVALWKETGFDLLLKQGWENGKVMCGISAGANCWFRECSSDSLKIKYGDDQPLIGMECLGFVDGLFVPHCDEAGRLQNAKDLLKESDQIGLSVSNCAALEIVDDMYRLITGEALYHKVRPFAQKSYWQDGEYFVSSIEESSEFKPLEELFSKNLSFS